MTSRFLMAVALAFSLGCGHRSESGTPPHGLPPRVTGTTPRKGGPPNSSAQEGFAGSQPLTVKRAPEGGWSQRGETYMIKIDLDHHSETEIESIVSEACKTCLADLQYTPEQRTYSDYGVHVDAADRPCSISLDVLKRLHFVDAISLTGKYLDSSILEHMQFKNSGVRQLVLHEVKVRAEDVRFLKSHAHLDYISLEYCRIGPGVLEALRALPFTGRVYLCGDVSKEDELFLKQLDQNKYYRVDR